MTNRLDDIETQMITLRRILLLASGRKISETELCEGQRATAEVCRLVVAQQTAARERWSEAIKLAADRERQASELKEAVLAAIGHECEY